MEKNVEELLTEKINSLKKSISRKEKELHSLEDQLNKVSGLLVNKRLIKLTELALEANEAKKFIRIDISDYHYYVRDFNVECCNANFLRVNYTEKVEVCQRVNNTLFPRINIKGDVSSKKRFGLYFDLRHEDAVKIHSELFSEKQVKNFIAMAVGNIISNSLN